MPKGFLTGMRAHRERNLPTLPGIQTIPLSNLIHTTLHYKIPDAIPQRLMDLKFMEPMLPTTGSPWTGTPFH